MVQMNQFAGQKLRHRCREQTYGQQGGKTVVGGGWWCAELGDWDWHVYTDVYKIDDWLKKKKRRQRVCSLSLCHVRTQQEGSHLQAMKRVLTRNWISQHLVLGFLVSRSMRNRFLLFNHPVYDIFVLILGVFDLRWISRKCWFKEIYAHSSLLMKCSSWNAFERKKQPHWCSFS